MEDDWSITQRIGRALRDAGFAGLIAPSAAGPYVILVAFQDRMHPFSFARVVSVTDLQTGSQTAGCAVRRIFLGTR